MSNTFNISCNTSRTPREKVANTMIKSPDLLASEMLKSTPLPHPGFNNQHSQHARNSIQHPEQFPNTFKTPFKFLPRRVTERERQCYSVLHPFGNSFSYTRTVSSTFFGLGDILSLRNCSIGLKVLEQKITKKILMGDTICGHCILPFAHRSKLK